MKSKSGKERKNNFIFLLVVILAFLSLVKIMNGRFNNIKEVIAAGEGIRLLFSPWSLNVRSTQEFDLPIILTNPNGDKIVVLGIDLLFDKSVLSVVNVTPDARSSTSLKTFSPVTSSGAFNVAKIVSDANSSGKISFEASTFNWSSGVTTALLTATSLRLATIRLRPKVSNRVTSVSFQFAPTSRDETNVFIITAGRLIDALSLASQLNSARVVIGSTVLGASSSECQSCRLCRLAAKLPFLQVIFPELTGCR